MLSLFLLCSLVLSSLHHVPRTQGADSPADMPMDSIFTLDFDIIDLPGVPSSPSILDVRSFKSNGLLIWVAPPRLPGISKTLYDDSGITYRVMINQVELATACISDITAANVNRTRVITIDSQQANCNWAPSPTILASSIMVSVSAQNIIGVSPSARWRNTVASATNAHVSSVMPGDIPNTVGPSSSSSLSGSSTLTVLIVVSLALLFIGIGVGVVGTIVYKKRHHESSLFPSSPQHENAWTPNPNIHPASSSCPNSSVTTSASDPASPRSPREMDP